MAKCLPEFISSLMQGFTKVMVNDCKPKKTENENRKQQTVYVQLLDSRKQVEK